MNIKKHKDFLRDNLSAKILRFWAMTLPRNAGLCLARKILKFSHKNYRPRNLRKIFVAAIFLTAVALVLPQEANGQFMDWSITLLLLPIKVIAYLINFIAGIVAMLGAFFLGVMINMNADVTGNNALVTVGWTIMRDVTNLGFVLVIITIGIATILRFKTYGMQALLPKLIAAAILVNFSLTIGNVIINFSQIMTNFFYQKISADAGPGLTNIITAAFGPQRLLMEDENPIPPDPEEEAGGIARFGAAFLTSLGGIFFSIIFTFLMAFILLVYAGMLFTRYLYLSFLLLLSPIIWLFWVVPAFSSYWSKWWSKFFSWTFFAPASAFFLYLALTAAENLSKAPLEVGSDLLGLGGAMRNGAQMAVLGGLLIGGLIAAQQLGIAGAAGAIGLAKNVGKKTAGYMGNKTWEGAKGGFGVKNAIQTYKDEKTSGTSGGKAFAKAIGFGSFKQAAGTVGNVATFGLVKSAGRGAKEIATGKFKENPTSIFSYAAQAAGKHLGLIKQTRKDLEKKKKELEDKIQEAKDRGEDTEVLEAELKEINNKIGDGGDKKQKKKQTKPESFIS